MIRVACYIDGFNVYHALDEISRASAGKLNYVKWLNVTAVMRVFTDPNVHDILAVKYFSAFANWMPSSVARHQIYVRALLASGVDVRLGKFKEKDIFCKNCKTVFKGHEEKESDVNIAVQLVADAYENLFDQAFVVSRDSDLSGPIRYIKSRFPEKKIKVIAPPKRGHSKELGALADSRAAISEAHLLNCLFPATVHDLTGNVACTRPKEYDPPS